MKVRELYYNTTINHSTLDIIDLKERKKKWNTCVEDVSRGTIGKLCADHGN